MTSLLHQAVYHICLSVCAVTRVYRTENGKLYVPRREKIELGKKEREDHDHGGDTRRGELNGQ